MIKLIKNGTVITMDEKRKQLYEKLDIVIENNYIKELTTNYKGKYDVLIDATDKVILPGLINCHTHLGMSIFRATNDNLNLNDWLTKKIWPIEDHLTDEDIYYTTLLSCVEMIKTGTTFSNDMYFGCNGSLKAIKESKTRCLFSRCLMDSDNKGEERINEFLKLYEKNKNDELIKFSVAPHSLYTCSKNYLKECSDLAIKLDLPLHIHFCENKSEVKQIKDNYKTDPVSALEELGMLRNKLILAHATFVDENLDKLKDKNISFIHNPISNLNLGCGISDISKYKEFVNISLGTDGQGSGNNMNLFYHMSVIDLLQKGLYNDPTIFSSYEVLKMATINGAKALDVSDIVGSIEQRKKADMIILNINNIENYPTVDLITGIVHNTTPSDIETTIINGEIIMQNHILKLDIDENALKRKIKEISTRLLI